MDVRRSSFNFPETVGESQSATSQFSFPREVQSVAVGIVGYSASYENSEDHHLGRLIVELDAGVNGDDPTKVDVFGSFGLRDWSGAFDDAYSGVVDFAVIVDLVPVPTPSPGDARGDLIVVDAEITQVIQHFRSSRHLDAANVFPDNSIRLVAAKPTAVRLYVDYDATSGLREILRLTGELSVTSGGVVTILTPREEITPRRDSSIDRAQRGHTLNFIIPEALCTGVVDISARVLDAFDNRQFSALFTRTLTFEAFPVLPIFAVAIDYTGSDVSDPAAVGPPTMSDFVNLLALTEKLYPVPSVTISNFITMTYDEEVVSDIGNGCDKLGDLRDAVADMRGDSDDIVYGLFNSGLNTGSVGGCGGGGVAVGRIGAQGTAAHEIGHALGRQHAPCDNVTRCADPLNTDDDYPDYSGFDSDSIGEYGFDTSSANGTVKSPAIAHDMMGYSPGRWISPYTYKALMTRIPADFGAGGAGSASATDLRRPFEAQSAGASRTTIDRGCWIPMKQQKLFLRFDIARDRKVTFQHAFHFPATPRPRTEVSTDFFLELHDDSGRTLRNSRVYGERGGCGCNDDSWPLKVRHAVAFDSTATALVIFENGAEIARYPIPAPPSVKVEVHGADDSEREDVEIVWRAETPQGAEGGDILSLVQWRDDSGTWRGLAPRTGDTKLIVPKRVFGKDRKPAVRVLASSGIATGEGGWEGEIRGPDSKPAGRIDIVLTGVKPLRQGRNPVPRILTAQAVVDGQAVRGEPMRWYDGNGSELTRGRRFDLGSLGTGQHQLTVSSLDPQLGSGSATWLVECTADDRFFLLIGNTTTRPHDAEQSEG